MTKKIIIPVGNQQLIGTLFHPEKLKEKNPAVLFLHGWSSDETGYKPRAQALTKLGYICLTISLRGHGESSGKLEDFSRADHIQDAIASYDFLSKQKSVDPKNISVVGASYGAYLAAVLASKRPIKHLAIRAPALYENKQMDTPTAQLINERAEEFFKNLHPETDNLALIGIKKITGNILLIESEKDQIIPGKITGLYIAAVPDPSTVTHEIMRGADHQLSKGEWKQDFIEILVKFFGKNNQQMLSRYQ